MQMVALTMMALALSEDSIKLRKKRNAIIDELGRLPDHIREVSETNILFILKIFKHLVSNHRQLVPSLR